MTSLELAAKLITEKTELESYLICPYVKGLDQNLLERVKIITDLLSNREIQFPIISGVGSTSSTYTVGSTRAGISALVSGIGTNVVLRVSVSNDGINWQNADVDGVDTIVLQNGVQLFEKELKFSYIKAEVVSFVGGSPSVVFNIRFS